MYAIETAASQHVKKLVQEQNNPKKSRKSANHAHQNQYSRNQCNIMKNEPRPRELSNNSYWPSPYQPNANSFNNNSRGYLPADAVFNLDKSSIESVHRSPPAARQEPQTSAVQARLTSSARHNDLNNRKEPNVPSTSVAQVTTSFQEMNMKKSESYNKKRNVCTEAIPFLNDVMT